MNGYLPAYEMKRVKNLTEALGILDREPGKWRPFAGGTDIMVVLEAGHLPSGYFLSIADLDEFKGIKETNEFIEIGSLATYTQIQGNSVVTKEFPRWQKLAVRPAE